MPVSPIKSLVIGLGLFFPAHASFIVRCSSRLYDQRSDPIVQPGRVSHHVHVLCGGNGLNFTMDFDDARNSVCSTCNVKQDMSAYWTPKLYYRAQDGSFQHVPLIGDDARGIAGGMNIKYLHRPGPDNDPIVPFPPDFRMVAGNPFKRTPGTDFNSQAVGSLCLGSGPDGSDVQYAGFPNVTCPGGLRMQVTFPSCWNGRDADAPDHVSHIAYPIDGSFDDGRCPSTHPVRIMTLAFEVGYQTNLFAGRWWENDDGGGGGGKQQQPFVLATGDPTGYGMHGDFLNGWDAATLRRAIDDCSSSSTTTTTTTTTGDEADTACPDRTFAYWSEVEQQRCKLPLSVNEVVQGAGLPSLPGCNPVSWDLPTAVRNNKNCADKKAFNPSKDRPLPPINGWAYLGCGNDQPGKGRTFPDERWVNTGMTHQLCVDHCDGLGYTYAGIESRTECYCGNSLADERAPWPGVWGNCLLPCPGDATLECGGYNAISMYKKS